MNRKTVINWACGLVVGHCCMVLWVNGFHYTSVFLFIAMTALWANCELLND